MYIGNTDMHIVTALFIIFEIIMLAFQLPFYLTKGGKMRKYYLILLILLIVKNLAMGFFPDPKIIFIPIGIQYLLTYGAGFIMASYFPFYFYKAYDIKPLKWHATRGIFYLLYIPFIALGGATYLYSHNIDKSIDNGLIIPGIYGIVLGYVLFKAINDKYKITKRKDYFDIIGVYLAVIPYASLAFWAYFRIDQVNEALLTNGGFVIITLLFFKNSVIEVRNDFEKLKEIESNKLTDRTSILGEKNLVEANDPSTDLMFFDPNINLETKMNEFGLTIREKELVRLLKLGYTNEEIGKSMNIQVSTVKKHLENTFKKVSVSNRMELV